MIHKAQLAPLSVRIAGLYALAVAAFVGLVGLTPLLPQPEPAQAQVISYVAPIKDVVATGQPVQLSVDRLDLRLPIKEGHYNRSNQSWTLDDTSAFYATITDQPNDQRGSTFIYGHNRDTAFAPLTQIKAGDVVSIKTDNKLVFKYTYRRDAIIQPNMTSVLYENPAQPQLVLMTCDGLFSEVRRIMYFQLTEVRYV